MLFRETYPIVVQIEGVLTVIVFFLLLLFPVAAMDKFPVPNERHEAVAGVLRQRKRFQLHSGRVVVFVAVRRPADPGLSTRLVAFSVEVAPRRSIGRGVFGAVSRERRLLEFRRRRG